MKKLILVLLLAGCAGFQPNKWVGYTEKDIISTYGVPDRTFALQDTIVWEYRQSRMNHIPIQTVNGTFYASRQRDRFTRFYFTDGVVTSAEQSKR